MKKTITPFIVYQENSNNLDVSKANNSLGLNNDSYFHKETFTQKNNKFNDYSEENKTKDDLSCSAENFIQNYEKSSNFKNIFSIKKEPKKTESCINTKNVNNTEEEISTEIKEVLNYSEENNDELNLLNSKDHLSNNDNSNDKNILVEPIFKTNTSNEVCGKDTNKYIMNNKLKEEANKWQDLEIDYIKKFELFNKCTNNSYVSKIINSINKDKKRSKELFKIYNIDNRGKAKLIGKKRKIKNIKRCEKSDDIRKKLKSRFHKIFTKKINDNLKAVNSEKEFYLMPQVFISNVSIKPNKEVMNMKLKDLLRKNFIEDYKSYKFNNIKANINKYLNNLNTLDYLEENLDIQEKCKFNIIGGMKYFEILEEFFYSKEFEDTVIIESKKKPIEYVKDYVEKARTYVKYFLFSDSD